MISFLKERNITRGTGIHLSSATRERLWARTSATTGPSTAAGGQNGVTSGPGVTHNSRPRRLSGSTNHYICDSNGYRNTENTSTFYYSPASQKSAGIFNITCTRVKIGYFSPPLVINNELKPTMHLIRTTH